MLASGHVGLAYLVYAVFRWTAAWPAPDRLTLVAIVLGALFPDLIDKPLAWELGLLASGRSLAHSLLTASIVILVVMLVAELYDRRRRFDRLCESPDNWGGVRRRPLLL